MNDVAPGADGPDAPPLAHLLLTDPKHLHLHSPPSPLLGERRQQRCRVSGRAAVPSLREPDEVGPQARHVAPRGTQAAVV